MARTQFTNGYALLIAVNENLMDNLALPAVIKDAVGLRDLLIHPDRCAYPEANVRLLSGSEASREGIYAGLSWLKERIAGDRSKNATAVLFYSGHGAVNKDDNSYFFLPYDVRMPLTESILRATDVAAEIEKVKPRRLLVMLDCCHAGGMGIKGDGLLDQGRYVKSAAPAETRSAIALSDGQGRAVLSSSTASESSYVRSDRKMSIFTYHLVEALTGYAQPDGATDVRVSDVMGYVSRKVPESARADYQVSQTPVYEMSGENFPIALLMGGEGISKGQPLPSPLTPLPAAGPVINTGGGAYIGGGIHSGGDVVVGDRTVGGDAIKGSKYEMSGDFRGAVLNIESQLANVTQTILAAPVGDAVGRADLNGLVASLQAEIERLPAGHTVGGEAVMNRLSQLSEALAGGDGSLAGTYSTAPERDAGALRGVRPGIWAIARQIGLAVRRLAGE